MYFRITYLILIKVYLILNFRDFGRGEEEKRENMFRLERLSGAFRSICTSLIEETQQLEGSSPLVELRDSLQSRINDFLEKSLEEINNCDMLGEDCLSDLSLTLGELDELVANEYHSGVHECFRGSLSSSDDVRLSFCDGSIIRTRGRIFSSCSTFWGTSSPLNQSVSLEDVRSSFVAEVLAIDLTLTTGVESGVMHLCICLDNLTSLMLCLEAVKFPVQHSTLLQDTVRNNPELGEVLSRVHSSGGRFEHLSFIWVRGHATGGNYFSLWNTAADRLAQERSREDALMFFADLE